MQTLYIQFSFVCSPPPLPCRRLGLDPPLIMSGYRSTVAQKYKLQIRGGGAGGGGERGASGGGGGCTGNKKTVLFY